MTASYQPEPIRPLSDWTINYARKMYAAGLVTTEQVREFVALFGDGLTVAEITGGEW